MFIHIYLKAEAVEVAGEIVVLDTSFFNLKHAAQITPMFAKKFLNFVQNAVGFKVKQFNIVNAPALVDTFLKFLSPFLKEKLRNRICLHRNIESLFDQIPKSMAPEEFGGTAGKIQPHSDKLATLINGKFSSWLKEQENIKSDETKRTVKPQWCDDLFGLDGTFKQLNVD